MLTKRLPEEDRMVRQIEILCQEIDLLGKQSGSKVRIDELLSKLEAQLEEFKVYRERHGLR